MLKPQTEQEAPGPSRTPASLTHLQDECLAVKGNLDGVHGVPIFLWQRQKGDREVGGGQGEGTQGGLVGKEWAPR